jgi:hypothetical protein
VEPISHQHFRFKKSDLGVFKSKNSDECLSKFENNCRIIGLTKGEFSLIDLIHSVLKKTGAADVISVTWSAGIKDVNNIKWMQDSHLIKSFLLVTDHSYVNRQKKYAKSIEDIFGKENILTSEIHAKFVLISNEKYHVTIRTSMNLNANRTCEQFEIDEDIDIFNFYKNFVDFIAKNQGSGFVSESRKVNKTIDLFFKSENQTHKKSWSEL